ncbi:MAG: hypothetical protein AAFO75_01320 [Pseudomonadota bacterium]
MSWPDLMRKETLAARIDVSVKDIDIFVQQGILPPPICLGEMERWSWNKVNKRLQSTGMSEVITDDPLIDNIRKRRDAKTKT